MSSLGFPFASRTSDLELKKLVTGKHQSVQTQKAPKKVCSLAKGRERGSLAKQNLWEITAVFYQNTAETNKQTNKTWPIPYSHQQRPDEEPRILAFQGTNESPQTSSLG